MSPDPKPLFRPEALRPHLASFALPPHAETSRRKLADWAKLLALKGGRKMKETELRDEFLYDVFRDLLGYTTAAQNPVDHTFRKEQFVAVDGTYADAGFGRFGGAVWSTVAVLEGKGPDDPLDRPFKSRKKSAFEQALLYAYNQRCNWFLVTNLRETRLYAKSGDQLTYERFLVERLAADPAEFARFVFLLGAERVVPASGACHLDRLANFGRIVAGRTQLVGNPSLSKNALLRSLAALTSRSKEMTSTKVL